MKETLIGVVLVASVIIGWSPASFYLDKWSDYWDPHVSNIAFTDMTERAQKLDRYRKAQEDCGVRTTKYFTTSTSSVAYDVQDPSGQYYTYECYGIKLQKIP